MADFLLQEDGSSKFILEDSSGDLLLEFGEVDAPFIATATVIYTPTVALTNNIAVSVAGTWQWLCPAGQTTVQVEAYGGGGGGAATGIGGGGGGGGGAYAARGSVPVTPGNLYTLVVGNGGASGASGASSTFTGDSATQVIAAGAASGSNHTGGAGGQASSSTGDSGLVHSGGDGGTGQGFAAQSGGGGASGNVSATGNNGGNATGSDGVGGVGANGGGSGGTGHTSAGSSPGGGGGGNSTAGVFFNGADGFVRITTLLLVPFINSVTTLYAPSFPIPVPFIASVTTVYTPSLSVNVPFIGSVTAVYTPTLTGPGTVSVPFISSHTVVYGIFSLFDPNKTYGGPGNGGEAFLVELNANGVTTTATLAADIGIGTGTLTMTGDSGLPTTIAFVVTIDTEQLYVFPRGSGSYSIHGRGLGNTTPAVHTAGATVSWGDTYQQAILAAANIDASFTADITGSGSTSYPGWLICFDSSQAYLSGSRYPMHVSSVLGVFDAGAGTGGTNRTDQAQPNAISTPTGTSDDCPAALSNPSLVTSDISVGDVALVSYTNPEATPLDLGPRAVTLQSWYGLKRVDLTDHDVTFTDPNGIVIDTTGTYDTFTGSVNGEWFEPNSIGISPTTGTPTPGNVPYTSVTLLGTDRKFTAGTGAGGYNEKGWPICCLAVRQGPKRVPFWQSWDWHNFTYVYTGFGTDATYAQILINRNGIVFGSVPEVDLPGAQDIDGPDAVWDDKEYYFGASWYVAIFSTPYLVIGPPIGGTGSPVSPGGSGYVPGVTFPTHGSPDVAVPTPPPVEGGSGGGISPGVAGLHVWGTSGKGFS